MNATTPEQIAELAADIRDAAQRHKRRYGPQVDALLGTLQEQYNEACSRALEFLPTQGPLAHCLHPVRTVLDTILRRNGWTGWTLCDLAPVLGITPPAAYPYTVLAYNALHLIDDGIDGHPRYDVIDTVSLYGFLLGAGCCEREAAATSVMAGMAVINESMRMIAAAGQGQVAAAVLRLAGHVYTGMTSESLYAPPLSHEAYHHIVAYKSIAYQMFLDHVFLQDVPPSLRRDILRVHSGIVRLGQLVDDLQDGTADVRDARMTILAVPGMNRQLCAALATKTLCAVWTDAHTLDDAHRDATAVRLLDWVRLLDRELTEEL